MSIHDEFIEKLTKDIRLNSEQFNWEIILRLRLFLQYLKNCDLLTDEVKSLYKGDSTVENFKRLYDKIR